MGRAPCCDKANVKRGPWSPEEDITLKNYVERHGIGGNWIALPQKAGLKRCGKSCRLRWLNYLRPDIKHGGFTEEEDHIICTLYRNIGSRWSVIASQLQGRTDNDVKNYWNTKLKKKILAGQINLNNPINHPATSSASPAMLNHNSPMDSSSRQDINVGSLGSFSVPGVPVVSSDFGTLSSDVSLPFDYSSWWAGNGIDEDYRFLTDYGFGSSYDILLSGAVGPNSSHAICSTSDSFMSNTSDTKPQGMYHSITN